MSEALTTTECVRLISHVAHAHHGRYPAKLVVTPDQVQRWRDDQPYLYVDLDAVPINKFMGVEFEIVDCAELPFVMHY